MFNFLVSCPAKGHQEAKASMAEQLSCSPISIQLFSELLAKISQRQELYQDIEVHRLASLLDDILTGREVLSTKLSDIVNDLMAQIASISRLVKQTDVVPVYKEDINQVLVYQLAKAGLLSLKVLHSESVFNPKSCAMETIFLGQH